MTSMTLRYRLVFVSRPYRYRSQPKTHVNGIIRLAKQQHMCSPGNSSQPSNSEVVCIADLVTQNACPVFLDVIDVWNNRVQPMVWHREVDGGHHDSPSSYILPFNLLIIPSTVVPQWLQIFGGIISPTHLAHSLLRQRLEKDRPQPLVLHGSRSIVLAHKPTCGYLLVAVDLGPSRIVAEDREPWETRTFLFSRCSFFLGIQIGRGGGRSTERSTINHTRYHSRNRWFSTCVPIRVFI